MVAADCRNSIIVLFEDAIHDLEDQLPTVWTRSNLQQLPEDLLLEANVAKQLLEEICQPDRLIIPCEHTEFHGYESLVVFIILEEAN